MRLGHVALCLLGVAAASGCLSLGGTEEQNEPGKASGGSGGGGVGDANWPDGAGGTPGGGTGGSGATGATGGMGGASGGAGGTLETGGTGATGGTGGTGATSAGGTGGAPPGWTLFAFDWASATWSPPTALELVWSGGNAPPSSGIAAVARLEHYDRLLVLTEAGQLHLRAGSSWQAPLAATAKFPELAGLKIAAVYHVASPPGKLVGETVTFSANPTAVIYDWNVNDTATWVKTVTMSDDPDGGAPQGSGTALWDFEVRDPTLWGKSGDYYRLYTAYSDGNVYLFDAAFVWTSWPFATAPLFAGKSNTPDPSKVRAAWFDTSSNRAYLIGPG